MIFQTNLLGDAITPANPQKPWESLGCCESCYTAKEDRCTCRCGGAFHGLGNAQHRHMNDGGEQLVVMDEDDARDEAAEEFALEHYRSQITQTQCTCGFEGLDKLPIEMYPHSGGWVVGMRLEKQWLYVTCPNCKYQWALWKLGVKR